MNQRVQGGLLADGINSFLACCFLTPPNTTFSQNTGVVSMTQCASRAAGFGCCFWLILAGVLVPFGAFLADAPTCVVGGIVTILFCSIMVSGIKILGKAPRTPRNHLIMSISLALGLGVATVPHMLQGGAPASFYGAVLEMNTGYWPVKDTCVAGTEVYYSADYPSPGPFGDYFANSALASWTAPSSGTSGMVSSSSGFHRGKYLMHPSNWVKSCEIDDNKKMWRQTVLLLWNTPYCIGFIAAVLLNLFLPEFPEEEEQAATEGMYGAKVEDDAAAAATPPQATQGI
jgi:hypothetical protein